MLHIRFSVASAVIVGTATVILAGACGSQNGASLVSYRSQSVQLGPLAGAQGPAGLSASGINGGPIRIVAGATTPGATNWQSYNGGQGLYVDVDTSAAGFTTTPAYIVTVSGNANNWNLVGGSSPYFATA